MLEQIRQNVRHPFIQILLALIILVFALFFGWSMQGSSGPTGAAAVVNGDEISVNDHINEYRQLIAFYEQLNQTPLTQEQIELQGLEMRALERLIDRTLLFQEADRRGITATDEELNQAVKALEVFRDEAGRFTKERMELVLSSQGIDTGVYLAAKRREIVLGKLQQMLRDETMVTDEEVATEFRDRNIQATADYVAFEPVVYATDAKLTEEKLAAYHAAEGESFRTQEQRAARYVFFPAESFFEQVEITDELLQEEYRIRAYQFVETAEATVRHILVSPDAPDGTQDWELALLNATDVKARLDGGADFATLAMNESADPGSRDMGGLLGVVTPGMTVPPFERAVFSQPVGEVGEPVRSQFGYHVILVEGRTPERQKEFDEVRAGLTRIIQDEKGRLLANETAENTLMDLEELKVTWEALGESNEVKTTALVTALQADASLPEVEGFQKTLFQLAPEDGVATLETPKGSYLIGVAELVASAIPPLDQIREEVQTRLREREGKRLAEEAAGAFKALALEESWEAAAEEAGLTTQTTDSFNNKGGNLPGLGYSAEAKAALFEVNEDANGPFEILGNYYVIRLASLEEPDMLQLEEERETLRAELLPTKQGAAIQEKIDALRAQAEIEITATLTQ